MTANDYLPLSHISRDMRRIGKTHEALGNHPTTFIDTGFACRYIPDPAVERVA
jgi:hypothetical protein